MRHPLQKGHLEGKVEMRQGPPRPHQNATTQKPATRRDAHTFSGPLPSRLGSARGGQKTCAPLCRIAQDRPGSLTLQCETQRTQTPLTCRQNYLRHERPPKVAGLWEFWGRVGGGLRRASQAFGSLRYSGALKPQGAPQHSPQGALFTWGGPRAPHRRL